MRELLGIIGIVVLVLEVYGWLRRKWIRHILEEKKKAKRPRKPMEMRPKSELDSCPGYLSHPPGFLNVKQAKVVTIMGYHAALSLSFANLGTA